MKHKHISEKFAQLTPHDIDRIVEMAWEDRTPFDAIMAQFGLKEQEVIALMRTEMHQKNWQKWRKRVHNRKTKHNTSYQIEDSEEKKRFRCSRQKNISQNRISKK